MPIVATCNNWEQMGYTSFGHYFTNCDRCTSFANMAKMLAKFDVLHVKACSTNRTRCPLFCRTIGSSGVSDPQFVNERRLEQRLGSALPKLDERDRVVEAKNALLAFICVEREDELLDLRKVAEDILRGRALLGVSEIVIGAFAHLSSNCADAMIARTILDRLVAEVRTKYPETKTYPFGWEKSLDLHVPAHPYSVAFRSFGPESGK